MEDPRGRKVITCASANGRPSRSDSVHLYAYGDYSGGGDGWTCRCGATTLWNQITADTLLSFDEGERAEGRVCHTSTRMEGISSLRCT